MSEFSVESADVSVAGVQFSDNDKTLPKAKKILKNVVNEYAKEVREKNRELSRRRVMQGSMVAYTRRTQELLRERHLFHKVTRSPQTFETQRRVVAVSSICATDSNHSLGLANKYFQTSRHIHRKNINVVGTARQPEYKVQLVNPMSQSDPTGFSVNLIRRVDKPLQPVALSDENPMAERGDNNKKHRKVRTKLVFLRDESQSQTPRKKKSKKRNDFEWVHTDHTTLKIRVSLPRVENEPESPTKSFLSTSDAESLRELSIVGENDKHTSDTDTCAMCALERQSTKKLEHSKGKHEAEQINGRLPIDDHKPALNGDFAMDSGVNDSPHREQTLLTEQTDLSRITDTKASTEDTNKELLRDASKTSKLNDPSTNSKIIDPKDSSDNSESEVIGDKSGPLASSDLKAKTKKKIRASILKRNRSLSVLPQSTLTALHPKDGGKKRHSEKKSEKKSRVSPVKVKPQLKLLAIKDVSQSLDIDESSYHKAYRIRHHDPPSLRKLKNVMGNDNAAFSGSSNPTHEDNTTASMKSIGSEKKDEGDKRSLGSSPDALVKKRHSLYESTNKTTAEDSKERTSTQTHGSALTESKHNQLHEKAKHTEKAKESPEEILSRYNVQLEQSSNPLKFPGGKITISDVTSYVDDSFMQKPILDEKQTSKRMGVMNKLEEDAKPCIHGNHKGRCRSCVAIEAAEKMLGQQIEECQNAQLELGNLSERVDRLRWGRSKLQRGPASAKTDPQASKTDIEDGKTEHSLGVPSIATAVEFSDDASLRSYLATLNDSARLLSSELRGRKVRFTEEVEVREIAIYRDPNKPLKKPRKGKKKKQQSAPQEIAVNGNTS